MSQISIVEDESCLAAFVEKGLRKYGFSTLVAGDLIEIDHKIPRSSCGKDSYDSLQLLHGHCHDVKTAADNVAVTVQVIYEDYLNRNPLLL